jgi:hypothetical protein
MQMITVLGAGLCLLVLFLKYKSRPRNLPPATPKQRLKSAKLLLGAILAWIALNFTLQHLIANIDGAGKQEPSMLERIVFAVKDAL